MSSIWTTILNASRSLLAAKGTQLMIRLITMSSAAVGVNGIMKDETTNTIAAGGVALLTLILDYISSRIQKTDAVANTTGIATAIVNENK